MREERSEKFEKVEKHEMYAMAEKLGYVESRGGPNINRGDLVPYDHESSPLSKADIADLKRRGLLPGVIYPKAPKD